jgi:hypothetical protein
MYDRLLLLVASTIGGGDLRFGGDRMVKLKGISEPQRLFTVEWK